MATALGVLIGLTPLGLTITFSFWLLIFLISGYVSLASIIASILYPLVVCLVYPGDWAKIVFAVLVALLVVYRHKNNLERLWHGEENRILYQNRRGAKDK